MNFVCHFGNWSWITVVMHEHIAMFEPMPNTKSIKKKRTENAWKKERSGLNVSGSWYPHSLSHYNDAAKHSILFGTLKSHLWHKFKSAYRIGITYEKKKEEKNKGANTINARSNETQFQFVSHWNPSLAFEILCCIVNYHWVKWLIPLHKYLMNAKPAPPLTTSPISDVPDSCDKWPKILY